MNRALAVPAIASWASLGIGTVAGALALLHPAADYVADNSPSWFVPAGVVAAIGTRVLARTAGQRYVGLLLATGLLLPTACALLVLHLLRLVGAIPLPLDPISGLVSLGAAVALFSLWFVPGPLAPRRDARIPVPTWVPYIGIAASLLYPTLKILWALGVDLAAPPDTIGVIDATFVGTAGVSLVAVPALVIAMRWWNHSAPAWARPLALVGGFLLVALGTSGLWAVVQHPTGAITGLLVYGGWLIWGGAVLATAGRLCADDSRNAPVLPTVPGRTVTS
jgi:hypothetical protein